MRKVSTWHEAKVPCHFQYCEVKFKEPDIINPDDSYKILTVAEKAGGQSPNKAKQVAYHALGESSDDYRGEWGEVPLAVSNQLAQQEHQLDNQIQKAVENREPDEMIVVMKEVRKLLSNIRKQVGDGQDKSGS